VYQPKTLIGGSQNGKAVGWPDNSDRSHGYTDCGVKAGARSFVSLNQNMVTPQASSSESRKAPRKIRRQVCGERMLEKAKAVL